MHQLDAHRVVSIMNPKSAAFACIVSVLTTIAFGQSAIPTSLRQSPGALTQEQREELRLELRKHAQLLEAQSAAVRITFKLVAPAVVYIESDHAPNPARGKNQKFEEAGSGVIIEWKNKFYVITNFHVVRDAKPETVKIDLYDGRRIYPSKLLADQDTDIAVLEIAAPSLSSAPLGDSSKLDIGDFVLAVGNPFGLNHSVTLGIISAKGRRNLQLGDNSSTQNGETKRKVPFQDFLQTDAAINPGNSGGPLVNLSGEVVGINTAIASSTGANEGIGFSIPSNMVKFVVGQLIETGRVRRALIGVSLNSSFGPAMAAELGLPRPVGALVREVSPSSPAEKAGIQKADVILEFNHMPIEDDNHLVNVVSLTQDFGKKLPIVVFRDRKPITLEIEVIERGEQ